MFTGINSVKFLGMRVRDRITGYEGIASSIGFDLYGCIQVAINPGIQSDGKLGEVIWFDTNRLEVVSNDRVMPLPSSVFAIGDFGALLDHGPENKPRPKY